VKKYTLTSIMIFVLGILFILGTLGAGYQNSISQYPDTSNIEASWILLGLIIGIIFIVIATVRTYKKAQD
jgi:tellurite resistance protein TehA-like permease